jgi:hypothetical protein
LTSVDNQLSAYERPLQEEEELKWYQR